MRINGYCCLGFVWKIIEPESASRVRAGRSISPVKHRTIYYQQVGAIKVKADRQIKDTELEQVCRLVPTSSVNLCSALHVKVIDPSQLSFCYLVEESVAPKPPSPHDNIVLRTDSTAV